jgi:hypothetical protein
VGGTRVSTDGQVVPAKVRRSTRVGCKKAFHEVARGAGYILMRTSIPERPIRMGSGIKSYTRLPSRRRSAERIAAWACLRSICEARSSGAQHRRPQHKRRGRAFLNSPAAAPFTSRPRPRPRPHSASVARVACAVPNCPYLRPLPTATNAPSPLYPPPTQYAAAPDHVPRVPASVRYQPNGTGR